LVVERDKEKEGDRGRGRERERERKERMEGMEGEGEKRERGGKVAKIEQQKKRRKKKEQQTKKKRKTKSPGRELQHAKQSCRSPGCEATRGTVLGRRWKVPVPRKKKEHHALAPPVRDLPQWAGSCRGRSALAPTSPALALTRPALAMRYVSNAYSQKL